MTKSNSKGGAGSGHNGGARVVRGTQGDDNLVGTSRDEVFVPLLGHDQVDGRGGRDTLVVDYGSVAPGLSSSSSILSAGGSFSGVIAASDSANDVAFAGIETLLVAFDDGDNHVALDGAALARQANVALDGNGGIDTLEADFSALSGPTNFRVAASGIVATNRGHYADFENFVLTLGSGADKVALGAGDDTVQGGGGDDDIDGGAGNDRLYGDAGRNRLAGGAGDDVLTSTGADRVDGGSGSDQWVGLFGGATRSLVFTFNGATGAGALNAGATLKAIENLDLTTGSGNDRFTVTGLTGSAFIQAGSGTDSLTVTANGVDQFLPSSIRSDGAGGLAGEVAGNDSGFAAFSGIDRLTYFAGNASNQVSVDAAALIGGATLRVDAAGGADTLALDLLAYSGTTFIVAPDGSLATNAPGTYLNFETFWLTVGDGTNVVTTGAGDDVIAGGAGDDTLSSGDGNDWITAGAGVNVVDAGAGDDAIFSGGLDTIDAGDGFDSWNGDYSLETEDLIITVAGGAGTFSSGTSFTNVEQATIFTGSGDDEMVFTGPGRANFHGGDGEDSLAVDFSSSQGGGSGGVGGGFEGSFNGGFGTDDAQTGFNGIEHVSYTASAAEDYIFVLATPLLAGATLSLDGGGGHDILEVDFTEFGDIEFEADDAGNVATNLGGAASFANFESYAVRGGAGDDRIVTASGSDALYGGGGTNFLSSGAGMDVIQSQGIDTVDGGDDFDAWQGQYGEATANLVFTFDGSSGTLSNGTQLANMEAASLDTGSGDDVFNISGTFSGRFYGGDGVDSLNADFSATDPDPYSDYTQVYFHGSWLDGFLPGQIQFYGFENVDVVASDGDSNFFLQLGVDLDGRSVNFDGGLGNDILDLYTDYLATDLVFAVANDGTANGNFGVTAANIERYSITTGSGNDDIATGAGDDMLSAGGGADRLDGGAGEDSLRGGEGDDVLIGGSGGDSFSGGSGADTFRYEGLGDFADSLQPESITDFWSADGDVIDLAGIDADDGTAGDQAFDFIGDAAFSGDGSGAELRYETDGFSSLVQGDIDGDGAADFTIYVSAVQSLAAADFIL